MKYIVSIVAALALAATTHAHEVPGSGPNGGQVRDAGPYHVELVVARDSKEARDNPLTVFLTDASDRKVSSAGLKATATLLAAGQKSAVELKPDGDNRLRGVARYASLPELKAVLQITSPDGRTVQARFEPLKPAP